MNSQGQVASTRGGLPAHIVRRFIHLTLAIYPLIYYYYGAAIAGWIGLPPKVIVAIIVGLVIVLEVVRLVFKIKVFGQRERELHQISSFTWGAVSVGLVLLLAPGKTFGIPIIWGCAFGDPLLGELRRFAVSPRWVFTIGVVFLFLLWLLCSWWLGFPWWVSCIMAPLTVLAEWPNVKWFDDNAAMQLVPLLVVLLFF